MPVLNTYPNQFGGVGRSLADFGFYIETQQGYCVVPTTPAASQPLLDISTGGTTQLAIAGSALNIRTVVSMIGVVLNLGNSGDVVMASTGTLRVGAVNALALDATAATGTPLTATPRLSNGNTLVGTSIPRGTVLVGSGPVSSAISATNNVTTNTPLSLFGVNTDAVAATAVNFSSATGRPAVVLITVRSLVRKWRNQTIADYPDLPRSVREQIGVIVA